MRSTVTSRRPSAAFLLAIVALFVALGGSSYAAFTINGKEIQKRSIPGNRIVPNALGTKQIDEAKLGVVPSAQNAQQAARAATADSATLAANATTAQDAQALQGRDASKFLASSVRLVLVQTANVADGVGAGITASCAASEKAIGGGAAWIIPGGNSATELNAPLTASMPVPATAGTNNMTGWQAHGRNLSGAERVLRAYAVCVPKVA